MEWIDALHGTTVALDTAPLIYYIEEHPNFTSKLKPFFEAAERGEFQLVTSFVTLLEVLVHPIREGRPELAELYRDILTRSPVLTTVPMDESIAEEAAKNSGVSLSPHTRRDPNRNSHPIQRFLLRHERLPSGKIYQ